MMRLWMLLALVPVVAAVGVFFAVHYYVWRLGVDVLGVTW